MIQIQFAKCVLHQTMMKLYEPSESNIYFHIFFFTVLHLAAPLSGGVCETLRLYILYYITRKAQTNTKFWVIIDTVYFCITTLVPLKKSQFQFQEKISILHVTATFLHRIVIIKSQVIYCGKFSIGCSLYNALVNAVFRFG